MIKKALFVLLILGSVSYGQEMPTVNVPLALRQENWPGVEGGGSCVHASMITLLRWQGQPKLAEWWRQNYDSGEYASRMAARMAAAGIPFAETVSGDPAFLDWALKTRRGCNVVVRGGSHMVTLVHFDSKYAGILDNNFPDRITYYYRQDFIDYWRRSGGWAYTPVYSPAPPLLKR